MFLRKCALSLLAALTVVVAASAAEVRGVITHVNLDKQELVLEGRGIGKRGLVLPFRLGHDARVVFGRNPGRLTDLAPGQVVRVTFDARAAQAVATLISVNGPKPATVVRRGPKPAPSRAAEASSDTNTMTGVLRRIALTDREIVIIGPRGGVQTETTFGVPEYAEIFRDQKPIALEELNEGERVTVRVEQRDGKLLAGTIQIGATAPTPPATEDNKIQKIRQVLKIVDFFLQMAEQGRTPGP